MLQLCVCRDIEHLGSLESTQEARVALGCASCNSYASLVLSKLPACWISRHTHADAWTNCFITLSKRSMQQLTEKFIIVGRAQSSTRQCLREYIFFLTVKLMFLSWNWEKVNSKMIVKSIFRCRKTINSPKNCYWEKTTLQRMISRHSPHSSRRCQQQQQHSPLFLTIG